MYYEAVVFDMDGVLLTGYHTAREVYYRAMERVLASYGIGEVPEALYDPEDADDWRVACRARDLPEAEVWRRREAISSQLENERIASGERPPVEDVDAVAGLSPRTGIVSNNRQATVSFFAADANLDVEVALGRDPSLAGYERLKPDPHYLDRALAEMGVAPEDALYVGDRHTDVEAARRAGADSALLARDGLPDGETKPDHLIESLNDLDRIV